MTNSAVNEANGDYRLSTVNSQFANEVKQVPVGYPCPPGYKRTEVGVIPDDWDVVPFGQILTIRHGKSQKVVESEHGPYPILATGGQIGWANSYLWDKPSVLIGRKGTINRPRYCDEPFWTVDTLFYSEVNEAAVAKFIFYKFCMIDWMRYNEASGVPSLNASTVESVLAALPQKEEQTAIANALSDVDALIQELEKLIAKKQAIKTATMQQLLTGRTRLPQFARREDGATTNSFGTNLDDGTGGSKGEGQDCLRKGTKQSELGEIPEDWEVAALRELLKESPKYGINAPAVPLEGKLPVYIRITDISEDGYFKPTEKVGVRSPFSDMYQLADGDIVLARTGASVGKSYLYRPEDGILVYAGFLIKVSPEQTKLKPKFLFQYLQTEGYWSWVTVNSMRSGQPGINGNEYSSLLIPCPRIEEQTAIATILSDMDEEIQALEQRLGKTRQIKQGMMQELLTGKTRLIQRSEAV